jgi:hypothetical protein
LRKISFDSGLTWSLNWVRQGYFEGLWVEQQRRPRGLLARVGLEVEDGGGEVLEREVVMVIQHHLFVVELAVEFDDRLDDPHLHVLRGAAVVVFLADVHHKLLPEPADGHAGHAAPADFAFDAGEDREEGGTW